MTSEDVSAGTGVGERYAAVRRRVEECARASGRDPTEVTLVAVSKTHTAELIREAARAGALDFGENRVQEAEGKIDALRAGLPRVRWHLIGHLQSNKTRRAARLFDLVHTIDSPALAERLERHCAEEGRERLDVLAQVDLGGEAAKAGATPAELPALARALGACDHLRLVGLMTLPPFFEETERVRPYFRRLRELRDGLREAGHFGDSRGELSMGMSHDFEVAVEEGATIVRVGTAIFGERGAR